MRKPDAISAAARQISLPIGNRHYAPAEVVCLALTMAIVFLAAQIAMTW
jgi:hypothetical protein